MVDEAAEKNCDAWDDDCLRCKYCGSPDITCFAQTSKKAAASVEAAPGCWRGEDLGYNHDARIFGKN